MKMFKCIFPLLLTLFMLSSNQSQAQIRDSFLYFKLDNLTLDRLFDFENMDMNGTFIITKKSKNRIGGVTRATLNQLAIPKVPKSIKEIKGPLRLKKDNNCYAITCGKTDCNNCRLLWQDRNKDGKVQPKKELRCVCLDTKEACQIKGEKVNCSVTRHNR